MLNIIQNINDTILATTFKKFPTVDVVNEAIEKVKSNVPLVPKMFQDSD